VRVSKAVRVHGGRAVWCDTAAFPEDAVISLRDGEIRIGNRRVPEVRSIYLRSLGCNPLAPVHAGDLIERPHGLLAQCREKHALLASLLLTLQREGVRVVNPIDVNAQHGQKPYQLELLRHAKLPVPRYIATNDPQAVRRFVHRVKRAVYKPLAGGATVREVEPEDLSQERLAALAAAPVLFQELVEGVAVRAYVIDGTVVAAAEIRSRELDYRRGEDEVALTSLTRSEAAAARRAAKACGMAFAGVDMMRSYRDHVILECNPSPMFAVFEDKTGADVAGALAESLLA
jgi:glutathione synthase/RimK-type ligase-like ATP-grasp enzyme